MRKKVLLLFTLVALLGVTAPAGIAGENAADDPYATADELGLMKGFPPPPDKRVTRANALLTPPFNRWSYLHMRMIFPSAGVPAADQAIALPKAIDAGIAAFDKGPDSDGIVHPKGEWSYRAQWWVKHTPGMEAFMAIGIHGQWIYLDPNHKIAVVKQSSQPKSKDTHLNGYDLEGFYAIVRYLGGK